MLQDKCPFTDKNILHSFLISNLSNSNTHYWIASRSWSRTAGNRTGHARSSRPDFQAGIPYTTQSDPIRDVGSPPKLLTRDHTVSSVTERSGPANPICAASSGGEEGKEGYTPHLAMSAVCTPSDHSPSFVSSHYVLNWANLYFANLGLEVRQKKRRKKDFFFFSGGPTSFCFGRALYFANLVLDEVRRSCVRAQKGCFTQPHVVPNTS